jgi:hypothetical protein
MRVESFGQVAIMAFVITILSFLAIGHFLAEAYALPFEIAQPASNDRLLLP